MKCPSCGYENSEDARYCNLCQNSFVREPAAPYGLPSLAKPGAERLKAAKKVLRSQPAGENWFQRHLNWTWFFAQLVVGLIAYIVVTIFVSSLFISSAVLPSEESLFASVSAIQLVVIVLQLIAMLGVGAWVLRRKKRSLVWLLIFLVPLVGWIIFLCLENRSEFVVMPKTPVTRSSISTGLAPQGLETRSDKYWW
jgi:uncharacterized membrane protein YhaH (DUF805 family)